MYFAIGNNLVIPGKIEANTTSDEIKDLLNQHFGFTALRIIDDEHIRAERPSYRDAAAFLYQPQNIIANPEALFYKLDEREHKRKLSSIFPYLLGAITAEDLVCELELSDVNKKLKRIQRESEVLRQLSERWKSSIEEEITKALILGLSTFDLELSDDFGEMLNEIRRLCSLAHSDVLASVGSAETAVAGLSFLRSREMDLSDTKADILRRLTAISEATSCIDQFGIMVDSLGEYTGISEWLLKRASQESLCPVCGQSINDDCETLRMLEALHSENARGFSEDRLKLEFTKEVADLRKKLRGVDEELSAVSAALSHLEEEQNRSQFQIHEIERFIGKLRASLEQYEAISQNSDDDEIRSLKHRRAVLRGKLEAAGVEAKIEASIEKISVYTGEMLVSLDMDNPDWIVRFDYKNLALRIRDNEGVNRYLNQIGSASNWLSYHIAFSLALQKYLQEQSPLTTPSFIFYDQPSQVYFPREESLTKKVMNDDGVDDDREAVRKIFKAYNDFLKGNSFDFQVIVTEHAGKDIWGEMELVHEVEHWTHDGEKLIPEEWIEPESQYCL